jgi:small subunit ribosomal protein S1
MMADEIQNSVSESTENTVAETAEVEDFSAMFEAQEAFENKSFEKGQIVEGIIVQIGAEFAYVNIGAKAEASIAVSELLNTEDGKLTQVVGDTIKAKIVGFEGGSFKLSRSLKVGNIALEEAYQSGCAVKALVKATNKGGFELEVMGQRAFCPLSQIQKGKVEDAESFVGQSLEFKVIKYAKRGKDIVLSRTALLEEENRIKRDEALSKLEVGAVLDGKVVSIQKYGAFVDVGGVEGLVHVSEICYGHIDHPKEALSVGQDVKVRVIALGGNDGKNKLSLSIKQLEEDPFESIVASIEVGSRVSGKVVRNVDKIGSFVDLGGVEGLIHISELSWDRRLTNPDDGGKVGQEIESGIGASSWELARRPGGIGVLTINCTTDNVDSSGPGSSQTATIAKNETWTLRSVRNDMSILAYCGPSEGANANRTHVEAWQKEPDGNLASQSKYTSSTGEVIDLAGTPSEAIINKIRSGVDSVMRFYPMLTKTRTYLAPPSTCYEHLAEVDIPTFGNGSERVQMPGNLQDIISAHTWLKCQDDLSALADGKFQRIESWMGVMPNGGSPGWDLDLYGDSQTRWSVPYEGV